MHDDDPPNNVLIEAVLNGIKSGVVFLVDSEIDHRDVERLVKKTEKLALGAIVEQFGDDMAKKFFVKSENPWILRTSFGGWIFFYPIEALTPETSLAEVGIPESVYWPNASGEYARVPHSHWAPLRTKHTWRPSAKALLGRPRSVWERLRDP
jgi:hypothetical protein